ncbi:DUF5329 family protein, partial [Desulfobulbus sp. F3]|nr:DUF5329 family protein [Desulfobulbus sp. F3]
MKTLTLLILLLLPCSVTAEQLAPQGAKEITALIEFVRKSPCRFNRNSSWHASSEAAGHIATKYHAAL